MDRLNLPTAKTIQRTTSKGTLKLISDEAPAPVDKLPVDILTEIFLLVVNDDLGYHSEDLPFSSRPLIHLTHVNPLWRAAALSFPSLWSRIPFGYLNVHVPWTPELEKRGLERLEAYLERSRGLPLHFNFFFTTTSGDIDAKGAASILSLLAQHSSQWRRVHLTLDSPALLSALAPITGNVPMLQTLEIQYECQGAERTRGIVDYFQVAPALRSVTLCLIDLESEDEISVADTDGIAIIFPWSQLEVFDEYAPSGEIGIPRVLQNAAHLRDLSWICTDSSPLWMSKAFRHTTLTTLEIEFETQESSFVLQSLELPALTNLIIKTTFDDLIFQNIIPLITNSACTLLSLTLACVNSPSDQEEEMLVRLLSLCPALTTLEVMYVYHTLLEELAPMPSHTAPSKPTLLPHLEKLMFAFPGIDDLEISNCSLLDAFLESRNAAIRTLEEKTPELGVTVKIPWGPTSIAAYGIMHSVPEDVAIHDLKPNVEVIIGWQSTLKLYADIATGDFWGPMPPLNIRKQAAEEVHKVLEALEGYELTERNILLLQAGTILGQLRRVATLSLEIHFFVDAQLNVPQRARTLLELWKPLMIKDFRENRTWVYKYEPKRSSKDSGLQYVPRGCGVSCLVFAASEDGN